MEILSKEVVQNQGFQTAGLEELNKEELKTINGGWGSFALRALRVLAVAGAAIHELIHDDVCMEESAGEPNGWASAGCEGCLG